MKKEINKNELKNNAVFHCIVLSAVFLLTVLAVTRLRYAYGSTLDWCSQHYVFPDYFRNLFYETGELFPEFAPHIGAGENIYYFSYYGLFSPAVMLSYLLPYVDMKEYIQISSIAEMLISINLFYVFISRKFRSSTAFAVSFLFMISPPLIFNSHRHIMFVNYMPFLIAALISADLFIEKNIKTPLILFTSQTVYTSWFFSIPSVLAIITYSIYSYLRQNRSGIKAFLSAGMRFALCMITSVMTAGILLLPSLKAVLSGRKGAGAGFSLSALLPFSVPSVICLSPYAFGLSCFTGLSVIFAVTLKKNKAGKFLGTVLAALIVFPVFVLLLNGGMYADGKVLIPFIPLSLILTAQLYEEIQKEKTDIKRQIFILLICVLLSFLFYNPKYDIKKYLSTAVIGTDTLISCIFLYVYIIKQKKVFLVLSMMFTTLISFTAGNSYDNLISKNMLEYNNSRITDDMLDVISSEENVVRSSVAVRRTETVNMIYSSEYYSSYVYSSLRNQYYSDFYFDMIENENEYRNNALITRSSNILFNIFMGSKYVVSKKPKMETGYVQVMKDNDLYLHKNDYVLPVGRSSDMLISRRDFDKLSSPERMEALVKCIVTEDEVKSSFKSTCREYDGLKIPENEHIRFSDGKYIIKSDREFSTSVKLDDRISGDRILLIFMDAENLSDTRDARIRINQSKNTITNPLWKYYNGNTEFSFVITANGQDDISELNMTFSDGEYSVSNIKAYTIDYPYDVKLTGEFIFEKELTSGDIIAGSIDCSEDGYFMLTVPYDEGFRITVDGRPQEYSITSGAFIGFPLTRGHHVICAEYHAPWRKAGITFSAVGLMILVTVAVTDFISLSRRATRRKRSSV